MSGFCFTQVISHDTVAASKQKALGEWTVIMWCHLTKNYQAFAFGTIQFSNFMKPSYDTYTEGPMYLHTCRHAIYFVVSKYILPLSVVVSSCTFMTSLRCYSRNTDYILLFMFLNYAVLYYWYKMCFSHRIWAVGQQTRTGKGEDLYVFVKTVFVNNLFGNFMNKLL